MTSIRMEPYPGKQGAVFYFDRPGRVDVLILDGMLSAFVYEGTTVDTEQEPLFAYDGTLPENVACVSYEGKEV